MAGGITGAELASLRADAVGWLSDSCDIMRKSVVSDNAGGLVESWALIGDEVPCAMYAQSMNPNAEQEGVRVEAVTQWVLTLPHDQDIDLQDQVIYAARTFEVANVTSPRTNQVVRRVVLNLVE